MKDLIVLAACDNIKATVEGTINNHRKLGISRIQFDVFVHPESDPGCVHRSHEFLRSQQSRYDKALVVFDHEGSGNETSPSDVVSNSVQEKLNTSGWINRSAVIVISPELENWVWSDSPNVDMTLGWSSRQPCLREWLLNSGFQNCSVTNKPKRPKEALEAALREIRKNRSSKLFYNLADVVSFGRCTDESFVAYRSVLQAWFS